MTQASSKLLRISGICVHHQGLYECNSCDKFWRQKMGVGGRRTISLVFVPPPRGHESLIIGGCQSPSYSCTNRTESIFLVQVFHHPSIPFLLCILLFHLFTVLYEISIPLPQVLTVGMTFVFIMNQTIFCYVLVLLGEGG